MADLKNMLASEQKVVNQDDWDLKVPSVSNNGYLQFDLNKTELVTYTLNKRFRQGENDAEIDFQILDGNKPHALDPATSTAVLYGKDSNGKYKIIEAKLDNDALSGRIKVILPTECFVSAGIYQRLMLVVTEGSQTLTTINLRLDVLPNDFYSVVAGDTDFDSSLMKLIDDYKKKIADELNGLEDNINNALTAYNNINNLLKTLQAQIDALDIVHTVDFNNLVDRVEVLENSFGHGYVSDIQLITKSGLYDGDAKTLNIPAQMPTAFGILANFKDENNGWVQIMGSNWYKQKSLGTWLGWANDSVYSKVVPSPINGFAPDYTKDDCLYLERHGNTVTFFFIGNIPAGTINDAKVMMPIPEFFRPNSQVIMRATPNGSITAGSCLLQAQGDSLTLLGNDNDDFQYVIYQNWEV